MNIEEMKAYEFCEPDLKVCPLCKASTFKNLVNGDRICDRPECDFNHKGKYLDKCDETGRSLTDEY